MLSKFSVNKPYTVVVAVVLVLILGAISFFNLQTDLLPEIDLPFLVINTQYAGASPEEVETVVTRPIEQIVATTNNIENVSSVSRENVSTVILEFSNDVNMDSALIEINGAIDLIKGAWGDEVSSPFIIRLNPDMLPVMIASVDLEGLDIEDVSRIVRDNIIPELESVNGVAAVDPVGLLEEKIEITISEEKIEDLNKKMLDSVDAKLSKAEDELLEGKNEIESNLAKLEEEESNQLAQLDQGESQLNTAKDQINQGLKEITKGENELLRAKWDLEMAINEMKNQILKMETASPFTGLAEGLFPDIDKSELPEDFEIPQGFSPEAGFDPAAGQAALETLKSKKTEAEAGLEGIKTSLGELRLQKNELETQRLELVGKSGEISQGRMALRNELGKAKDGLNQAKAQVEEGQKELEEQKERALEEASLTGIITKDMINGIITAQNFSMPAGYIEEDDKDYVVKIGDKLEDIDELRNLILFDTGVEEVGIISLKDIASVEEVDNADEIYAKINGNNAIMLSIQKQSNFSISDVSENINERIEELKDKDESLNIIPLLDQGEYIEIVVSSVLTGILYGGLLAILVLFLFLRDLKPTIVIALSVPISIVFAITLMYFTGVTLNIISLAGLALGVGMLVDNSIVVIENIYRMRSEGISAHDAAITGAKEVAGAIMASTVTTAGVFLPIVFTTGLSRQLFTDMGLTIAYSLFASLIVALSLVPMMASTVLRKTSDKEQKNFGKFVDGYEKLLRWALSHKALVMGLVLILLVASGYFALSLGTAFIPDMDAPQMSANIMLDEEASMEEVEEISDKIIERISQIEDIKTVGAFKSSSGGMAGFGGPGSSSSNNVALYILLEENKKTTNIEIGEEIKKQTEDFGVDISVTASNMDMNQIAGQGVEIQIKGREIDALRELAEDIGKIVASTEGVIEVEDGVEETALELRLSVDKKKAMEEGLTVAQVFSSINKTLAQGRATSSLSVENKDFPIIVIEEKNQDINRSELEELMISSNQRGEEVEIRLGDIVTIEEAKGLAAINRESQQRYLSVTGKIHPDYNIGLVGREVEESLVDYQMPEGYSLEFKGENETINDSLRDLVYMLLLAIVFIYLIMVAQFQSLLSPFIIMFTIPLAFTGGLMALIITGNEISLISMLGFLVLTGVVVNNGIVFVDYTNQLRERGRGVEDALVIAGKTRMRPILMTAITTVLGLSPLALGIGVGSEVIQPLAIVATGGLIYATLLTLLVVPVMYRILNKDEQEMDYEGEENGI